MENEDPSYGQELAQKLRSKKNKKRGVVATVVFMTIAFHVIAGIIAAAIAIVHEIIEEAEDFVEPPVVAAPQKRPEYQINIQKLKKQSSPPRPRPIVVHNPNNINLPALDVPNIDTNIAITGRGSGGFGVGVGGGSGPPTFDVKVEFFGVKGGGEYIAFLVDYSGSMSSGTRNQVMRRELTRTIEQLPDGTHVAIIPFAGIAWDISEDLSQVSKDWVALGTGAADFYPKSKAAMSGGQWVKLKSSTRNELKKRILSTPLVFGTVFDTSFYIACNMDPLPKTIFFMTDGACSPKRGIEPIERMMKEIQRVHGSKAIPVINTIGLEVVSKNNFYSLSREDQRKYMDKEDRKMDRMDSKEKRNYKKELDEKLEKEKAWWERNKGKEQKPEDSGAGKHLINIAKLGKGTAVFLSGEEYIEEHGEDRKIDWSNKSALWKTKNKVDLAKFPKEKSRTVKHYSAFSLLDGPKKDKEVAKK